MTLEELRSALETAKLSSAETWEDCGDTAAINNLIDWAEGVQTFLEAAHEATKNLRDCVPDLMVVPDGCVECRECRGSGRIREEHEDFDCSACGGAGHVSKHNTF